MFTEQQIDRLITNALEGADGHTEYTFDNPSASCRYVVGGAGSVLETVGPILYYTPAIERERIRAWINENKDAETLGFWTDEATGVIYFDAGDTYAYEGQALHVAHQRGELAIWDRVENREVRLDTAAVPA